MFIVIHQPVLYLGRDSGPDPMKKFSALIYATVNFEHTDWLMLLKLIFKPVSRPNIVPHVT